jgi:hypothetical protein
MVLLLLLRASVPDFFIESQLKVRDSMSRAILRAGASKKGKQTVWTKSLESC